MKRYALFVVAALAVALGAVGGALAGSKLAKGHDPVRGHADRTTSLVPAPQVVDWLEVFRGLRPNSKPEHSAKAVHTAKPAHAAKPTHSAKPAHTAKPSHKPTPPHRKSAKQQPHPQRRLKGTTSSIYEHTAKPWVARRVAMSWNSGREPMMSGWRTIPACGMPSGRTWNAGTL